MKSIQQDKPPHTHTAYIYRPLTQTGRQRLLVREYVTRPADAGIGVLLDVIPLHLDTYAKYMQNSKFQDSIELKG